MSKKFMKWLQAPDDVRAPYIAERVVKHIEIYRLLSARRAWVDASEIAKVIGCTPRHLRRILKAFEWAGYIELERGGCSSPMQARIKDL